MGADPQQTLRSFREAEAYDGPSLQSVDQRWDTYEDMAGRGPARYPADARKDRTEAS
jgi:hypothetical protein